MLKICYYVAVSYKVYLIKTTSDRFNFLSLLYSYPFNYIVLPEGTRALGAVELQILISSHSVTVSFLNL